MAPTGETESNQPLVAAVAKKALPLARAKCILCLTCCGETTLNRLILKANAEIEALTHLPSGRFATTRCRMQTTLFSGDRRGHGTVAASFWRRPRDLQGSRPVPLSSAGRLLCSRRQAIGGERRDWKPRASGVFFGLQNLTTTSGSGQRGSPSPARSAAIMVPLFAKSQPPPNAAETHGPIHQGGINQGRSVDPISQRSHSRAAPRPSAIAQTTRL